MGLTNEHVGPKILAKIKIYALTRAELLFQVCYEIPCNSAEIYHLHASVRLLMYFFLILSHLKNQ